MTAPRIMLRGFLLFALGCAMLAACATTQTKDEATRDAIHEHLVFCTRAADQYTALHGFDAFRAIRCDVDAELECKRAGLEHNCGQYSEGDARIGAWR